MFLKCLKFFCACVLLGSGRQTYGTFLNDLYVLYIFNTDFKIEIRFLTFNSNFGN